MRPVRVIDVDPELLHRRADASTHAAVQANVHVAAEVRGDIPHLMETLTPTGPYAYAIKPEINADGTVNIPIATTRDDIEEWYKIVRGASSLLPGWPVIEVRGEWYVFQEQINRGYKPATPEIVTESETIAIFPSTEATGITGELVWFRLPREALGAGTASEPDPDHRSYRKEGLRYHDRYLDALRAADVDGILDVLNDGAQAAIRDYVNDTGTLIGLRGVDDHRAHYEALFSKYEVLAVDMLHRVVQDWYVFAEIRVIVRSRGSADAGSALEFRIAEFFIPANDGRFIGRIGHGTDPA